MFTFLSNSIVDSVKAVWGTLNNYGIHDDVVYSVAQYLPQDIFIENSENNLRKEIYFGLVKLSEGDDDFTAEELINHLRSKYPNDSEIIQKLETFTQKHFPETDDQFFVLKISGYEYKNLVNTLENHFVDAGRRLANIEHHFVDARHCLANNDEARDQTDEFTFKNPLEIISNTASYIYSHPTEILLNGLVLISRISSRSETSQVTSLAMTIPVLAAQFLPSAYAMDNSFLITIGGNSTDNHNGNGLSISLDDSLTIAGYTVDGFGGTGQDIYISKHNSDGTLQWALILDDAAIANNLGTSVKSIANNELIVAGYNQGSSSITGFLVDLFPNGAIKWAKKISDSHLYTVTAMAKQTNDGLITVLGYTFNSTNYDLLLSKHNVNDGSLVSAKKIGTVNNDYGFNFIQNKDGGLTIAGYSHIGFPPNTNDVSTLLYKLANDGTLVWGKTFFGTNAGGYAESLVETFDYGLVIIGTTTNFSPSPNSIFLCKFSSTGQLQWAKAFGVGAAGYDVIEDSDHGLIITGTQWISGRSLDIILYKFDSDGLFVWGKVLGGEDVEVGVRLQKNSKASLVLLGVTYSFGAGGRDFLLTQFSANNTLPFSCAYDVNVTVTDISSFITVSNLTQASVAWAPTVEDWVPRIKSITPNITHPCATINYASTLTGTSSVNYTENAAALIVNNAISVADIDNDNLTNATVTITTGFKSSQDRLSFVNQNGITGSYSSSTGILTLSGSASVANYQTALRSVTYINNSNNPTTTQRAITFKVNDGSVDSNILGSTVSVTAVNDAPVFSTPALTIHEGETVILSNTNFNAADVDNNSAELLFTVNDVLHGRFELVSASASAMTTFTQVQINAGNIQFVQDGSSISPSFSANVKDSLGLVNSDGNKIAQITFFANTNSPTVSPPPKAQVTPPASPSPFSIVASPSPTPSFSNPSEELPVNKISASSSLIGLWIALPLGLALCSTLGAAIAFYIYRIKKKQKQAENSTALSARVAMQNVATPTGSDQAHHTIMDSGAMLQSPYPDIVYHSSQINTFSNAPENTTLQPSPYPTINYDNDKDKTIFNNATNSSAMLDSPYPDLRTHSDVVSSKALHTTGAFAQTSRVAVNAPAMNQHRYNQTQTDLQQQVMNQQ